ncbi:hypothetical protein [Nostoc sp. UHCC 0870]|uniref:hypothetical protein n=1 Tax=Nostoc sp. UHCC 0870 TaxID=2914041 RepID=UPI001EDF9739|nr:hypothetical protein [Nostoc sp. UHCC 0870]UKO96699.1 hypothetical protein L6494_19065 [Nostoc sp. UHCC 0870]
MSSQITAKHIGLPIMSLFLALIANSSPVQGQISNDDKVLLAQSVFKTLPPPPNYPQNQPVEFNQYQPAESSFSQSFQRYSVYVENTSNWTLQQVRRVEPTAYIRQYNGRSVIQSGVFNRLNNAQQRVRELNAIGIYGASVAGFDSGQELPYYPDNRNSGNTNNPTTKSRYYISIPAKSEDLFTIANQIRQFPGLEGFVTERKQPLGPHVAVGPFSQRTDAQRWNNFIRDRGFGNARVYYRK